jgi:hypothetical protein
MLAIEQNDEWLVGRRYLSAASTGPALTYTTSRDLTPSAAGARSTALRVPAGQRRAEPSRCASRAASRRRRTGRSRSDEAAVTWRTERIRFRWRLTVLPLRPQAARDEAAASPARTRQPRAPRRRYRTADRATLRAAAPMPAVSATCAIAGHIPATPSGTQGWPLRSDRARDTPLEAVHPMPSLTVQSLHSRRQRATTSTLGFRLDATR